jgi:hypothetical protein
MPEPGTKLSVRLPRQELKQIARGLITHELWGTSDPDELRMAFGFLLTLFAENASPEKERDLGNVGFVYAAMSDALPRAINGVPMFLSARFVHVNDMPALSEEYERMREALNV